MSATHARVAIGVDLGGTNIRAAVVTEQGEILDQNRLRTPVDDGQLALPSVLVEAITECVEPLLEKHDVIGLGMGCGGQFNPETGVMLGINTDHPAFVNVPLADMLRDRLSLPVYIDNDVKAAAYAELKIGAGSGYQHIICVAAGTFIGGALILDGKIVNGARGLAGHLGQMLDFQTGILIEDIAGGFPLGQRAIRAGLLNREQTTQDLFTMARAGHHEAQQFIAHAGRALGYALVGLAHFIQPEVILVGGTVGIQREYLDAINESLGERLMSNWQSIRAIPMQLGTEAGQIGAGLRVFDELNL